MPRAIGAATALLLAVLGGCTDDPVRGGPTEGQTRTDSLRLVQVASGLEFPTYLTAPPGDTSRLFVTEKAGTVRIIRQGMLLPQAFLDLRQEVSSGGERGLLSLAFHPAFTQNRRFFVYLTNPAGDVEVREYRAPLSDPERADPASGRLVIRIPQPYSNHNGGQALFGPDGKLYLGVGDGGSGGDPHNHGQNRSTLLGSILRLDVDAAAPYAIPGDNPFVSTSGARGEVWAYGLRNPWRFSFDRSTGDLYVADVGQNRWEELNVLPFTRALGANYGWRVMEGSQCFRESDCDRSGLVLPTLEYEHPEGCSVTGGYVYRGQRMAWLQGTYFCSDYCGGWIRSFRFANGEATERRDWTGQLGKLASVPSFGEDAAGELYVLTERGEVLRLAPR